MQEGILMQHTAKIHMCLSVSGALKQVPNNNKLSFADHDNGHAMTNKELRAHLMKAQHEGKRVLPMGDCDNFDDQEGCRGHGRWSLVADWYFEQGNG